MNTITIEGFLGAAAESRLTSSGKYVTNLNVAHTPREKRDGQWVDGETIWFIATVWDDLSANIFEKGTRVVVAGQLFQRSYEHEGTKRVNLEIKNASVGVVYRTNANGSSGSATVSAVNDDWAMPVNPESDATAPF
jgi:single-strand DNA-binding protein